MQGDGTVDKMSCGSGKPEYLSQQVGLQLGLVVTDTKVGRIKGGRT